LHENVENTKTCIYLEGFSVYLPNGTISNKKGYFLEGWYDNAELIGDRIDSIGVADPGDKDFYAKWFELKTPTLDAADNCYEISDAAELYGFAQMMNGMDSLDRVGPYSDLCAKLTKDIVVNENVLKGDGTLDVSRMNKFLHWLRISQFWGTFDGQGHSISGLYMSDNSGMFGTIFSKADGAPSVIRNLTIDDSYSIGDGLVSYVVNPLIMDNCHFKGYIDIRTSSTFQGFGGLVGHSDTTLVIKNSSFEGAMISKGYAYMGGLVGSSYNNLTLIQNFSKGVAYLEIDSSSSSTFSHTRAGSLL